MRVSRWSARRWPTGSAGRLDALARHVMAAGVLHADDTPVPVLAPGMAGIVDHIKGPVPQP